MSWVRVWIHLVFSTKNNRPLLKNDIRNEFFQHIQENATKKGIWLQAVNGYTDHIHCLIALNKDQCLSKIVQLIKGESSYWINKKKLLPVKFMWQDDYWAVSISESHLEKVQKYIQNQEQHHKQITFREEVEKFMKVEGWQYLKN